MKLESKQTHVKIPLSSLKITTNVRTDFDQDDIAALAKSIKENGLVNAITVKPPVTDENGVKIYEVIAGGRRVRAHQWLCDHGDDFSMIDAKILTGDLWTLQMIENIQRTDLSQREKENAIKEALEKGMTQKEIADRLSKPISYVSDILAGSRVREVAEKAGQNTDGISTKALAQLRGIEPKIKVQAVKKLKERGGTVAAATQILRESKSEKIEEPEIVEEKPPKKLEEKYSVYGCFTLKGKRSQLDLDGIYSLSVARQKAFALKEMFPAVEWLLYDELERCELELGAEK